MRRVILTVLVVCAMVSVFAGSAAAQRQRRARERRLPVSEYVDKMKGGWIGQMAGVGWGEPTEFKWNGVIIPEDRVPKWRPELINMFHQDDLYVEMTFLRTLELYGYDVSIRQAGIDFANSGYMLWHANKAGRDNLRNGIAPPDSGHPAFNRCADDIDYQIEADFSGLIAPGLPNLAIQLGEKFGRLMNYGDGLYGGQFVGGMYCEAFFETDMLTVVEAGLRCVPEGSQFAECMRDVIRWYHENPDDWQKTWHLINEKYQKNPAYRRFSCDKGDFNIDAKINAAFIVMGLLYGKGDMDQTIIISMRCGQDSDCNPSNAGGVLGTALGYSALDGKFKSALNQKGKFSHTPYDWPTLVSVCEKLARDGVVREGGRIEKDGDGQEVFVIPVRRPRTTALEQCWEPGPIANSRFTEEEMAKITMGATDISAALKKVAPGWVVSQCGPDMGPGLRDEHAGRKNVLMTHPLNRTVPCVLSKTAAVPAGKKTKLSFWAGHHPGGDWDLIVKANGDELFKGAIGEKTAKNNWTFVEVDLSKYAGKEVKIELFNKATEWAWEAGYWDAIQIVSQ
ncbi:MAG: ADP-ribosylglycohydrolase family protein [Phycisphaerae bacterium]|nr:ADP-ribosylglycohydrolase family protein [Phycisphaerae bacterium]